MGKLHIITVLQAWTVEVEVGVRRRRGRTWRRGVMPLCSLLSSRSRSPTFQALAGGLNAGLTKEVGGRAKDGRRIHCVCET